MKTKRVITTTIHRSVSRFCAMLSVAILGATAATAPAALFILLDEDAIDNTTPGYYLPPNTGTGSNGRPFTASGVNDDIARVGLRTALRFFRNPANFGRRIVLRSGHVGDEGFFAFKVVPTSWKTAGPTTNGLRNFLGRPLLPFPHKVGNGLGQGDAPEELLDKVPHVTPLRATGLKQLEGQVIAGLVWDGDIGINYGPLNGNLQGSTLGVVAFKVVEVKKAIGFSDSALPLVTIEILDPATVFVPLPTLFTTAPEPTSSSEPFDVTP